MDRTGQNLLIDRPYRSAAPLLRLLVLLFLAAVPLAPAACGTDLPVEYAVQDSFTDGELAIISQAAEDWNLVTRERLGSDALVMAGRFTDPDGFYPYDDLNRQADDGPKLIYRLGSGRWLDLMNDIHGGTDDSGTYAVAAYNTDPAILVWPEVCRGKAIKDSAACLRTALAHEFGHAIGLAHLPPGISGLMSPYADINRWPQISAEDVKALCLVHDCLHGPP